LLAVLVDEPILPGVRINARRAWALVGSLAAGVVLGVLCVVPHAGW